MSQLKKHRHLNEKAVDVKAVQYTKEKDFFFIKLLIIA